MRMVATSLLFWGASLAFSQDELDAYNVQWTSPSKDSSGSMPIGNGEMGLNVWVEASGDLVLYVSRTDSFSEACRLLKVGQVRVKFDPNPFRREKSFKQTLNLRQGSIDIGADDLKLTIFVDSESPVAWIRGSGGIKRTVTVDTSGWRTERKLLKGEELNSSWTMKGAPMDVWESADVIGNEPRAITVWHRNETSIVPFTWQHQGMSAFASMAGDPLLRRTFGLRAHGLVKRTPTTLVGQVREFNIQIASHCAQTNSVPEFANGLANLARRNASSDIALKRTSSWWREFWDRSYIFVEGDQPQGLPKSEHPLRLGADSNGQNAFVGAMGRATFYGRAMTEAEVKRLSEIPRTEVVVNGRERFVPFSPDFIDRAGVKLKGRLDGSNGIWTFGGGFLEKPAPATDISRGFTCEAWIKPSASVGRIFDKVTAGGSDGFLFDTYPGFALRCCLGSETYVAPNALSKDTWAHVALVVTAQGDVTIFRDGEAVLSHKVTSPRSRVTEAYILQRWVTACAGRGNYPIKFNGSIFTVEPDALGFKSLNPDWRRWGDCYWFQNTRLPYHSMLASGDIEMMDPLFKLYENVMPIAKARTREYWGSKGVYFPETMTMFGGYGNNDYGWDRTGLKSNDIQCPWWMYAWNQGPELLMLMLDRYAYQPDRAFLDTRIVPMAREVLGYFESRFVNEGKLRISPTQSVETYWKDVVNDTPSLAGLHAVLNELVTKPIPTQDLERWLRLRSSLPPIPVRDGKIMPAEAFNPERSNVENPEFYAIWPFRLFSLAKSSGIAVKTYDKRIERSRSGWQYDGQVAAYCGLADEAKSSLLSKVANSNPAFRFPAMWGPNYDWLPDQCHGGNIMTTLQSMLLYDDGTTLKKFPAWPKGWNVKFKLRARGGKVVTGVFRNGKQLQ